MKLKELLSGGATLEEKTAQYPHSTHTEVRYLAASEAVTRRFFLIFCYEPRMKARAATVKVMIIAPVKGFEFRPACEAIGGKYIKLSPASEDCIGWLEIRRRSLDIYSQLGRDRGDSLIADKIAKTHILFGLLKPDITVQERNLLDDAVTKCYARFGLTHDNRTLFEGDGGAFRTMPTLTDLEETMQVIRNKTGEGLLCAGHNRISVAFQSTRLEYNNITTRRADLEAQL